MSTGKVGKFEQTLKINQNYKLFQSGMLRWPRGGITTLNFTMMMMTSMLMMMMMNMMMTPVIMMMMAMRAMWMITTWVLQ